MKNEYYMNSGNAFNARLANFSLNLPRKSVVGIILMVALLSFEIFNFDTTQYALRDLLGDVRFLGLQWASILAIAFCSIDFAGLVSLFTPEKRWNEPKEVWYLMGAWLLGATMNAIMTWWAISLTLLNHSFGNEVLSRAQLLQYVPVFVAVLVWLTRILFIGAFTVAGDHIFDFGADRQRAATAQPGQSAPIRAPLKRTQQPVKPVSRQRAAVTHLSDDVPGFLNDHQPATHPSPMQPTPPRPRTAPGRPQRQRNSRIRQRPPQPNGARRMPLAGVQARPRDRR